MMGASYVKYCLLYQHYKIILDYLQMGACLSKCCPYFRQPDDILTDCESEANTIRSKESFATLIQQQQQENQNQDSNLKQHLIPHEPKRSQSLTQIPTQLPYTIALKNNSYSNQLRKHRSGNFEINTNENILSYRVLQSGEREKADTRMLNDRSAEYPYNCIGLIYRKHNPNSQMIGTGFAISSHLVLTAAHNVYNKKKGVFKDIKFLPGIHGSRQHFEERQVMEIYVSQEYKQAGDKRFDYALVRLNRGVERDRYIMIGQDYPQAKTAEIFGYPKDKLSQLGRGKYYQFGAQGKIQYIKDDFIFYWTDTMHGQSGSPIVAQFVSGLYFAIGIHTRYDEISKLNCGTQLTNSNVQRIRSWMAGLSIEDECIIINCKRIAELPCYSGTLKETLPQQKIDLYLQQVEIETNASADNTQLKRLYIQIAKSYRVLEKYDESMLYLKRAGQICSSSESDIACIQNEKGMIHFLNKNYEDAKKSFKNAFYIYKELKKTNYVAATLANIGNSYNKLKIYEKAAKYHRHAITLNQKLPKKEQGDIANCYCNYASVLQNMGTFQEAEAFYHMALQMKKKSKKRCDEEQIYKYYYNLANCHLKQRKIEDSLNEYFTAIDIMIKLKLTNHRIFRKSVSRLKEIINISIELKITKEVLTKMCRLVESVKQYDKQLSMKMDILLQYIQKI